MIFRLLLISFLFILPSVEPFFIPLKSTDRSDLSKISLTAIGKFGLLRKARTTVPAHLHTGIDIKRPENNYNNEPIFAIAKGKVISKRSDGPYAQLIIEHEFNNTTIWTVYEHIAGIAINLNETVDPGKPIARFMNKNELDRFGWQFDHFHFEILKVKPLSIKPDKLHPERQFNSYTLCCYNSEDLQKYYYEPLRFMKEHLP
ncbi:MAG TPA: M23 family metallopeptidase [Bacteroidia bacterium]|jgi:murein DD-endopeptidase MepM/ murein hydrolase activator NlpD